MEDLQQQLDRMEAMIKTLADENRLVLARVDLATERAEEMLTKIQKDGIGGLIRELTSGRRRRHKTQERERVYAE